MSIRRQGRRFAWLMTGAAIGTTVVLVLLLLGLVSLEPPLSPRELVTGVALGVLLGGLLGLVPGVRELEVTAARSMLGVRRELLVPLRSGPIHRVQDVLWVQLHLLLGLLIAAGLTMLLPASMLTLVEALRGGDSTVVPTATSGAGRVVLAVAALVMALAALAAPLLLGQVAARLAPRLLGPTSRDRLELALARIDREAESTRIARDLHDGIGHALTIVSIQAAAGGHVIARDPDAAAQSLERIEVTAREALLELDAVLADLRDEAAGPGGSTRLEQILEDHRRAGLDLRATVHVPRDLPRVQDEHLARIVAELLTNAHRHGGAGAVRLHIAEGENAGGERCVLLEASNPLAAASAVDASADRPSPGEPVPRRGGRGLPGLHERLDLWGGMLEAGPADGRWHARAQIPILSERPPT